ncbi:MAG: hypothetical protein KDA83_04015 [Planctomycetales bacterium]|nr:hypothetical protein [Planctomycetales bacterium]
MNHESTSTTQADSSQKSRPSPPTLDFGEPEWESVAIPLHGRGWLVVVIVMIAVVFLLPRLWSVWEPFEPTANWRTPSATSEDYWQWQRFQSVAESEGQVLLLGDSVTWGEYARPNETLSAELNRLSGEATFANLGLQGLYPISQRELLRIAPPQGPVLLLFNPIWMTSERRDLSWDEEAPINHTLLLPQFDYRVRAYQPRLEERLSRYVELRFEPWRIRQHWRLDDLEGKDWATWNRAHPGAWPWDTLDRTVQAPLDQPHSRPMVRRTNSPGSAAEGSGRSVPLSTYAWVSPKESLQFEAFRDMVDDLRARHITVAVLVSSLSPTGRSAECLDQEAALRRELTDELRLREITVFELAVDGEWMADASHPSPAGYQAQATALWSDPAFQRWLSQE